MYNCRRVQTPLRMGRRSNEKNARYGRRRSLCLSLSLRVDYLPYPNTSYEIECLHFIYISLTLLSGSTDHMVETGRLDHLVDTFSLITWSKLVGLTIWSMLIGLANWSMLGGREFVDASTESPLVSILASKCFDCMLCL